MTDRENVKSAHRPNDPLGPWLTFHPANIPCDECASKPTDRERVKPWDAVLAMLRASYHDQSAGAMGAVSQQEIARRDAATLRAYATALRLLETPIAAKDDRLHTYDVVDTYERGYRAGHKAARVDLGKALRGEEGE